MIQRLKKKIHSFLTKKVRNVPADTPDLVAPAKKEKTEPRKQENSPERAPKDKSRKHASRSRNSDRNKQDEKQEKRSGSDHHHDRNNQDNVQGEKQGQRSSRKRNRNRNKNKKDRAKDHHPHFEKGMRHIPEHKVVEKKVPPMPELKPIPEDEEKARFADFGIAEQVQAGLQDLEFKYCTPIQEQCLPLILTNKDITGKAQTGTGKTAAFLTAIFTKLLANPIETKRKHGSCRVLVLAPTRELALQIYKDAEDIAKYTPLVSVAVFGGMAMKTQQKALGQPIDLLVGTPGRILDFMRQRKLHFNETEILVIDEADRMLDMGFIPDVTRIVSRLPGKGVRQTLFFSATMTGDILRLIDRWLKDPVTIDTEPDQLVAELIEQVFYSVPADKKFRLLTWHLKHDNVERALIFVNRRIHTEDLAKGLRKKGVKCDFISGDIAQKQRLKILEAFRSGENKVLVATDVAARGIHVENISHVFNFDLPVRAEEYVHRIGRTGRAGETGKAISFVCEYGAYSMMDLEEFLGEPITTTQPEEEMLK